MEPADRPIDDNPLWTRKDFEAARPASEMVSREVADQLVRKVTQSGAATSAITEALRAEGPLLGRARFAPHSLRAAA